MSKIRTHEQPGQVDPNVLLGEKCLKLATLRLIADNISFLRGRLDQAWIVEARSGVGTFELVMVRSYIGHVLH